jgi:hypothetical protein
VGAIKVFLKEVLLPIALAFCLASFLKPIYMPDGVCDYFLMWICVGLPFGIRRMCLWLVPSGYGISGSVGIFALNLIIGGLIGGLAFFIGLLLGVIHTIRRNHLNYIVNEEGLFLLQFGVRSKALFFCCPKAGIFAGDAAKERSF